MEEEQASDINLTKEEQIVRDAEIIYDRFSAAVIKWGTEHPDTSPVHPDLLKLEQLLQNAHQRLHSARAVAAEKPCQIVTKKPRLLRGTFNNGLLSPIDLGLKYVTLPKIYLEKAGLSAKDDDDLVLYCRPATREQFLFLEKRVVDNNARGIIIGPPGTGKSVCTLAFMASLNRDEWLVIWIHLGRVNSCLVLNTNHYKLGIDLNDFMLSSSGSCKRFVCIDGYKAKESHEKFYNRLVGQLCDQDRIVVCSSMGTLGKTNEEDDTVLRVEVLCVSSWTKEEYLYAISN